MSIEAKNIKVGMTISFQKSGVHHVVSVASVEIDANDNAFVTNENGEKFTITWMHAVNEIKNVAAPAKKQSYLDYILARANELGREANRIEMNSTDPAIRQAARADWASKIAF